MEPIKQIYLDSDDDITDVIGKLAAFKDSRVALVPPKRSTTLQSVVNLKLLKKAAASRDNELVLITRDPAILNVASQLKLLTAPNLEAEPVVPEAKKQQEPLPSAVIDGSQATDQDYQSADQAASKIDKDQEESVAKEGKKSKKNNRIPDFNRFKKYLLIGLLVLVVIGAAVWALLWAPRAEITIRGLTQEVRASFDFRLDPTTEDSDLEAQVLAAEAARESRTLSATFEATGTDTIGERASGQVTISNCYSSQPITIDSGTAITAANGLVFRNDQTVTVPGAVFVGGCVQPGEATVNVTADDIGEEYNIGPTSYAVAGYPSGSEGVNGSGGNMTGGSSEEVAVVTSGDIARARERLLAQERENVETSLRNQFDANQFIIEASLDEDVSEATSEPEAGGQADTARLVLQVTYTLIAVALEDMEALLAQAYLAETDGDEEHLGVIDSGLEEAAISATDENLVFAVVADGVLGPDIDEIELKDEIAGMAYNRAIETIRAKPNVTAAEIELSPFWVSSLPNNPNRISVEFDIAGVDEDDEDDSSD